MKNLIIGLALLTLLSSFSANANTIYCASKYFNNDKHDSTFTATIASPTSIENASLKMDGELIFTAKKLEKVDYRPSPAYANFISVMGELQIVDDWGISKILLEKDFYQKDRFQAVIAERASDGGSYNKFYCYNTH